MDTRENQPAHSEPSDTSAQSTTNSEPTTPKKKRSSKRLIILAGVVVVVLLAAVGAWFAYTKMQKTETGPDLSKATRFESTSALVTAATESAKGVRYDVAADDGLGGTTEDGFIIYSYPSQLVDSYSYRVQPVEGHGSGYAGDSMTASSDYKAFVKFFTDNHYVRTSSIDGNNGYISLTDSVAYVNYSVYESTDALCSVWHADATNTTLKAHVASVGCADKSSYKTAAAQLKPFFEAYKASDSKTAPSNLIFGTAVVADGKDGYKNASVYQDDPVVVTKPDSQELTSFQGLYYMAPGSSTWTYVSRSKASTPVCSTFNTDVLKKAFSGTKCTDASGKATTVTI